jgi:guanylate kinase
MTPGHVFVLIGPSGSGKTTLADMARRAGLADRIVTCTTRAPRAGEVDGVHYHFLPAEEFDARFQSGELLEREFIHGHWYGVPESAIVDAIRSGRRIVVPLGYEGARRIKSLWPEHTTVIFIMPPGLEALRERLGRRGDHPAVMAERLAQADQELALAATADAVVVNEELDQAFQRLRTLMGEAAGAAAASDP